MYGKSAGYVYLHADKPSADLYAPTAASIRVAPGLDTSVAMDSSHNITSIQTPNLVAYFQAVNNGYAIYFTNLAEPWDCVASVTIASNNAIGQMLVTEIIGPTPRTFGFNYTSNGLASGTWDLVEGSGLRSQSSFSTWDSYGNRTNTMQAKDSNGAVAAQRTEQYSAFPWGLTLAQRTLGSGSSAQTTRWNHYTDTNSGGCYGQVAMLIEPSGRWERYQYDSLGRLTNKVAQFGNNGTNTLDTANRVTQISFGADDFTSPITTIEKLLNSEVSRTYEVHALVDSGSVEKILTIRCAHSGAGIGDSANLTNILWRAAVAQGDYLRAHDPLAELRPDGTMTFYQYSGDSTTRQTIVQSGAPGWTWAQKAGWTLASGLPGTIYGTRTTSTVGRWGEPVSTLLEETPLNLTTSYDIYDNYDSLKRSHRVIHLDNTSEQYNYGCCGLDTYIDRDWATTYYKYDDAKRQVASTRLNITTTNVLDAAGNVLKTIRIGTDTSTNLLRQAAYDLAGRMTNEVNALYGVTSYTQALDGSGQTVKTSTYPDGGTRVETYYQDGSLLSVSGTAAHPLQYLYGADGDGPYTTEIKVASGGGTNEWVKTSTDMLGRAYKTTYAGTNGTPYYSVSYYNSVGQLTNQMDPDNVSTILAYNPKGEQAYSALASNRTSINFAGVDQITFTTNDVVSAHNTTVRRTRTYVWGTFGSDVSTLVSTVENSVEGLQSWQTQYRDVNTSVTNHSQTTYGFSGTRTVTNTAPDNSYTVATYQYGRLLSASRYDSGGNLVSSLSYSYDPHGRQSTITDARNGATTFGFNDADLVASVTTPNPGTLGGSPQTTLTYYNNLLQATNVVQPDGTSVISEYYLTGELKRQYGSRTYPVGYGYDYAGRMNTMTNWSGFPSTGARVTTWNYDSRRGWLIGKTYDGGVAGPSYGYTAAGRLQTRSWARGVTTTYGYNWAGALASVSYSDSTPGVTTAYDRLGRVASTLRNGITNTMAYNTANQVLSDAYSGGTLAGLSVTNGYDQYLRRTSLWLGNQPSTLQSINDGYDNASRLQTVTDNSAGTAYSATYSYLANSPLVSQIVFKQSTTTRMTTTKQYDYLNRLTAISSAVPSFAYSYNAANQRIRSTLSDGSYWLYTYDSLGQVVAGNKYWTDGTPVAGQQFDYAFDTIGNRTSTLSGGDQNGANLRSASYSANTLNQYTSRSVPGAVDAMGLGFATNAVTVNGQTAYRKGEYFRQQLSVTNASAPVWQSVTNAASGQSSVVGALFVPKTPEVFYYDADGNLTNDGRWRYTWDAENRLVTLTTNTAVGPQQSIKFEYDWKGRRIRKQVWSNATWNGTPTNDVKFVYDGWNLLAELNATNNNVIRSFMWGLDLSGSLQGAGGVGGLLEVVYTGAQSTNCFVAFDGNGNVAALTDAGGAGILAQYEYGPFGEVLRATGPMAKTNPFRFSTKYQDEETDLLYYGNRYYSGSTGRWISRDPVKEKGGLNLYGFVGSDPVNKLDILGLLETRFRRNSRTILGRVVSGPWSQPDGFGEGAWTGWETGLSSWIHLWSGPAETGICNSMLGCLPYPVPPPPGPGEPRQSSQHAGAFTFEARNKCSGSFRLYFELQMVVKGKGPNGNAKANMWLSSNGETSISVIGDESKQTWFGTYIDVVLTKKWKPIIYYYPTILFNATQETPLKESEGWAFGYVNFIAFDAL